MMFIGQALNVHGTCWPLPAALATSAESGSSSRRGRDVALGRTNPNLLTSSPYLSPWCTASQGP
jgi:hypothetical protein